MEEVHITYATWSSISASNGRDPCRRRKVSRILFPSLPRLFSPVPDLFSCRIWIFGGEFSAPNQSSFHHYRDLWSFDIPTSTWERWDTKLRPSARSGHRMCVWKNYIFLFGVSSHPLRLACAEPAERSRYCAGFPRYGYQDELLERFVVLVIDRVSSNRLPYIYVSTES